MKKYKVEDLGQVFTPVNIVNEMISMIKNGDRILEPSCGDGVFLEELSSLYKNVIGIEFDNQHCPINALNMDFFDYSVDEKFDTII